MPKKLRVRLLMESQQAKGSETLLKSSRHSLCYIFLITLKENQLQKIFFGSV